MIVALVTNLITGVLTAYLGHEIARLYKYNPYVGAILGIVVWFFFIKLKGH